MGTADPLRPTLMTRLRASLGGERDARVLEALRQAGLGAYQEFILADQIRAQLAVDGVTIWTAPPGIGSHLLAAWSAEMLQRLGETVLNSVYAANPDTVGYVYPATFQQVWHWLSAVEGWLARAGEARGNPGYDISALVALPAGLTVGPVARDCPAEHRDAMLLAMTVLRQHAEVALHGLEVDAPADARHAVGAVRQMAGLAAATAEYVTGLRGAHDDARLHALIDDKVRVVLNLWFHIGQLASMPKLLGAYRVPAAARLLDAANYSGRAPVPPRAPAPLPPPRPAPQAASIPHTRPQPAGAEVRVFEGHGDGLVRFDLPKTPYTAVISHYGASPITVWSVTGTGSGMDLLVNKVGVYHGERPLNFVDVPSGLKISTSGTWRIVVRPLHAAPEWTSTATGAGAAVLRVAAGSVSGLTLVRFGHGGPGYVRVTAYGEYAESLVSGLGPFNHEVLLPESSFAIEIDTIGGWNLHRIRRY